MYSHNLVSHAARSRLGVIALAVALTAGAVQTAEAQSRPRQHSTLYYRLGGGDPAKRPGHTGSLALHFGLGAQLKLNYSCGRFDLGLSWSSLMDNFANFGTTVTNAVKAGISALPLYILQRAQPGLYQIFQTYSAKADAIIAASLKTCEEMEAAIKQGRDPYAEWAQAAKGITWRAEAKAGAEIIEVKKHIGSNPGVSGHSWFGTQAGGKAQRPMLMVGDVVRQGYFRTLNDPMSTPGDKNYAATPLAKEALVRAFPRANDAAAYAADVLGEESIATCDNDDCPPKETKNAVGLTVKYEAEVPPIRAAMVELLAAAAPTAAQLDAVAAPGVAFSRELVDAFRELPEVERGIAMERMVREIALARTIEKALAIRNVYITGMTMPDVVTSPAQARVEPKIALLNRFIEELLFEGRVRKELVTATASTLLDALRSARSQSTSVELGRTRDAKPVTGGAIKP